MFNPSLAAAFLAGLTLLAPARAFADDTAQAREHFVAGTRAFELGQFSIAVDEYAAAYRLRDDPALLYNLGQAHRLAGHPVEALRFYRLFLSKVPDAPNRPEIQTKIDELRKLVEQQRRAESSLPPDTASPPMGARGLLAIARPHRPPPPPGQVKKVAGLTIGSVGAALLVGGIVSGALAQQTSDRLTHIDRQMGTFDYGLQQTGKTEQLLEGVFLGVGAAAVAGGVVLYLVGRRESQRAVRF